MRLIFNTVEQMSFWIPRKKSLVRTSLQAMGYSSVLAAAGTGCSNVLVFVCIIYTIYMNFPWIGMSSNDLGCASHISFTHIKKNCYSNFSNSRCPIGILRISFFKFSTDIQIYSSGIDINGHPVPVHTLTVCIFYFFSFFIFLLLLFS